MTASERRWPRIIGHRGAALTAPENTLAGFCMAAALNVEWVEFDVRLTSDGRCILLHDDTLDRTTSGRGPASRLTFEEIRRLDAGSWFSPDFAGQPVPGLEETIGLLAQLNVGAVVELKPAPGAEAATGRAAATVLVERWPAALPPPVVSSFKPAALAGLPLFAYTVNLPQRARELFSWGVQAIFSDCPDSVAQGLAGEAI
jgi:glycerophosphoryl diester phosphodiesterase